MTTGINGLLEKLGERAAEDLRRDVDVNDVTKFPDKDDVPTGRSWLRLTDVVAVVADLKNSTALSFTKHPKTSTKLYEAVTRNCVDIVSDPRFAASFVDIQGDGLFALYHGPRARQRAMCAAITLKTFSQNHLAPAIEGWEQKGNQFPDTGLKVGMHAGTLAVKHVGVWTPARQWREPVWAGRPVNWAFKCAQQADAHQLVCTRSVYGKFDDNDYVTHSCPCGAGPSNSIWQEFNMQGKLPADKAPTKLLTTRWCAEHGDEYCQAILDGKTSREDVPVAGFAG